MIVLRNSKIRVTQSDDVAKVFQDLLKLEDPIDRDKEHFVAASAEHYRALDYTFMVIKATNQ